MTSFRNIVALYFISVTCSISVLGVISMGFLTFKIAKAEFYGIKFDYDRDVDSVVRFIVLFIGLLVTTFVIRAIAKVVDDYFVRLSVLTVPEVKGSSSHKDDIVKTKITATDNK